MIGRTPRTIGERFVVEGAATARLRAFGKGDASAKDLHDAIAVLMRALSNDGMVLLPRRSDTAASAFQSSCIRSHIGCELATALAALLDDEAMDNARYDALIEAVASNYESWPLVNGTDADAILC
jgi:hypothetical protein